MCLRSRRRGQSLFRQACGVWQPRLSFTRRRPSGCRHRAPASASTVSQSAVVGTRMACVRRRFFAIQSFDPVGRPIRRVQYSRRQRLFASPPRRLESAPLRSGFYAPSSMAYRRAPTCVTSDVTSQCPNSGISDSTLDTKCASSPTSNCPRPTPRVSQEWNRNRRRDDAVDTTIDPIMDVVRTG